MTTTPPDERRLLRAGATAALAGVGLGVHLVIQRLAPAARYEPGAWLSELAPFLPWTIWIYLLFFPFVVAVGALVRADRWRGLVAAWTLASIATWALVLLVPVTFARPESSAVADPVHRWVFGLVYGIDDAHITFPCLHSAATWIGWLAVADRGPRMRRLLFVLAVLITLSTMTTRQHLLTDNVAGVAIAWLCARVALRPPAALAAPALSAAASTSPDRARRAPRSR